MRPALSGTRVTADAAGRHGCVSDTLGRDYSFSFFCAIRLLAGPWTVFQNDDDVVDDDDVDYEDPNPEKDDDVLRAIVLHAS